LGREIAWEGEGVEGGTWAGVGDGFGGVRWIGGERRLWMR